MFKNSHDKYIEYIYNAINSYNGPDKFNVIFKSLCIEFNYSTDLLNYINLLYYLTH